MLFNYFYVYVLHYQLLWYIFYTIQLYFCVNVRYAKFIHLYRILINYKNFYVNYSKNVMINLYVILNINRYKLLFY